MQYNEDSFSIIIYLWEHITQNRHTFFDQHFFPALEDLSQSSWQRLLFRQKVLTPAYGKGNKLTMESKILLIHVSNLK